MSLEQFMDAPWQVMHSSYDDAFINIRPAPEFSTAEVLIASLYRSIGFDGYGEGGVPKAGREFSKAAEASTGKKAQAGTIRQQSWRTILHGVLESPKQPNQSSKRFLQLSPVVPDVALYSGSARLSSNSWAPGKLIQRMIQLGSSSDAAAEQLWSNLFQALSVGETDDMWARWLQSEFEIRGTLGRSWKQANLPDSPNLPLADKASLQFPAKQFCKDLSAVIDAKGTMTRRQWISILEAIIRVGAVTHVLWLCRVNSRLWDAIHGILLGGSAPASEGDVRRSILSGEERYLAYGNASMPTIRNYASAYLVARLGINLVLWALNDAKGNSNALGSSGKLLELLQQVEANRDVLIGKNIITRHADLKNNESRVIACKKGIGTNLIEFSRYVLGQRQTANESLRGYDQSYFLRKQGVAKNSKFVLSLGPVAVLALVHCCLREVSGPRSVQKLCEHLSFYGIDIAVGDITKSDLGKNLRMLGLVLDSPDAESGMLLVPPFGVVGK